MSSIVENSISIFEAINNVKNGKYVMPAFQRQFIWSLEQIEKLWDSILLDYPISTFLFWKVDENNTSNDTYFCEFLSNVIFDSRKQADSINYELQSIDLEKTNIAVLDGQQRLTSFYISLLGETFIRPKNARRSSGNKVYCDLLIELNKHKLTVDEEEFNSKKFDIRFTDKIMRLSPTQFKLKQILDKKYHNNDDDRKNAIENAIINVPADSKEYARNILNKLCAKIYDEKLIRYTEILNMNQDDALEMFVRFNSGGKALKKSDITMSILEAYWPNAKTEFGNILSNNFENFGTDFIIRSALMLYGDVVKSNINKDIAENLKNNWNEFVSALNELDNILAELKIDKTRFSNSWNVLLPVLYYIYYNPNEQKDLHAIKVYILRAIMFTYFQSGTTGKLQQMKSNINEFNYELTTEMLNQMYELRVTDGKIDDILNCEKGSRIAGEVLYYLSLDWINKKLNYQQDHLHPSVRFDMSKPSCVNINEWKEWRSLRDRLPNLQLLEGRSNGSKNDMSLNDYYNEMNETQKEMFYKQAFIPQNESLEISNFKNFYTKRKEMLGKALIDLLN